MPSTFGGTFQPWREEVLPLTPHPLPPRGETLIETLEGNKMPGLSMLGDPTDKATRGTTPGEDLAALGPPFSPCLSLLFLSHGLK